MRGDPTIGHRLLHDGDRRRRPRRRRPGPVVGVRGRPRPTPSWPRRRGLTMTRELLQMRVPLPSTVRWTSPTRPFEPGRDEDAFLAVNNRAFASHPEQGGWTARHAAPARGRGLVRPGRLPAPRARRPPRRVLLDQAPPRRVAGARRDLRHRRRSRLPGPRPRQPADARRAGSIAARGVTRRDAVRRRRQHRGGRRCTSTSASTVHRTDRAFTADIASGPMTDVLPRWDVSDLHESRHRPLVRRRPRAVDRRHRPPRGRLRRARRAGRRTARRRGRRRRRRRRGDRRLERRQRPPPGAQRVRLRRAHHRQPRRARPSPRSARSRRPAPGCARCSPASPSGSTRSTSTSWPASPTSPRARRPARAPRRARRPPDVRGRGGPVRRAGDRPARRPGPGCTRAVTSQLTAPVDVPRRPHRAPADARRARASPRTPTRPCAAPPTTPRSSGWPTSPCRARRR